MAEKSIKLNISGMTCDHCADSVLTALHAVPGVVAAEVYMQPGYADVRYDDEKARPEDFTTAVKTEGYEATVA
jgi:copper chaperone CopZ